MTNGVLEIDTKGVCLLCLKPCEVASCTPQLGSGLSSVQGFEKLLRYLNVNTTGLFNCSPQLLQVMEIKEDIVMGITLCSECAIVTESFDQLYKQYELIRIQFDNCVQSVHASIKSANESPDRVREYTNKLRPKRLTEILNASLATNLRNETFKKCSSKLQSSLPRVSVLNVETEAKSSFIGLSMTDKSVAVTPSRLVTDIDQTEQIRLDKMHHDEVIVYSDNDDDFSEEELDLGISNAFSLADPISTQPSTSGGNISCPICFLSLTQNSLRAHTISIHPDSILSPFFPPDSSLVYTEELCKTAMEICLSQVDSTDFGYTCPYCSTSTKQRSKLKHHILSIHPSTFAAEVIEYARRRSRNHLEEMEFEDSQDPLAPSTPSKGTIVKCDGCNKYFPSVDLLNEHLPQCHPSEVPEEITCAICNKCYGSRAQLNAHMLCHGDRNHVCPHCPHTAWKLSNLKCHINHVHVVEEMMLHLPPEVKDQCGQVVEGMLEELRQVSSLQCMYCDMTVASIKNLRMHVLGTHHDEFLEELKRRLGISPGVNGGQEVDAKVEA